MTSLKVDLYAQKFEVSYCSLHVVVCLSQRGAVRGHAKTLIVVDVETYDFAHFD